MRNKRFMVWLLTLIMSLSLSVPALAADLTGTSFKTVNILHTNDVHGRFVEDTGIVGIATIAAAKEATENALLVDAGDAIHGLPFATIGKGADAVKLMDQAGYDVLTPGNHDFNYGYERLLSLTQEAHFDVLSANIKKDGQNLFDAMVVKEVDGVRIGFLGLTTRETTYKTASDNIVGLTFDDPIASAKVAVEALKQQNVDVIVAVTHLGMDDTSEDTSIALAEAVPEIDVIIDGHSHSELQAGLTVNGVVIVSARDNGGFLGCVAITLDGENQIADIAVSLLGAEEAKTMYGTDAGVEAVVQSVSDEQDILLGDVVATISDTLNSERSPGVRTQEMPLGNLIADALLEQTGADIAFTNGGGLRATIEAGDVTKKAIVGCLPFGNFGVTKYVTPALLKDLMENGLSSLPEADGRFPQIAGFALEYDINQPVGSRVLSITYKGDALDLNNNTTSLLLATNDFLAKGGDNYAALQSIETETEFSAMDEIVIAYLSTNAKSYSAPEGRIVAVEATNTASGTDTIKETVGVAVEDNSLILVDDGAVDEGLPEPELPATDEAPAIQPFETKSPFPIGAEAVVDGCYFLNVRRGSDRNYAAFTYLTNGDVIVVLDYQQKWIKIETDKGEGWVYEGYLILR